MSRAVWFVAGAGAGVYSMLKARRAAEAFTPDGLTDRLAGLSLGLHLFGEGLHECGVEGEVDRFHGVFRVPKFFVPQVYLVRSN